MVLDADSGSIVQRLSYDVWGRVTEDTNPGFQPFGFAGGLMDRDKGLLRFGARDYDPEAKRRMDKDPIRFEAGIKHYAYAGNDPVNWIDPSGLDISIVGYGLPGHLAIKIDNPNGGKPFFVGFGPKGDCFYLGLSLVSIPGEVTISDLDLSLLEILRIEQ